MKKGSLCEPGNYRPVSLKSQIGKIFWEADKEQDSEILIGRE